MKFKFKIQPCQTDAIEYIVRVFNGQSNCDKTSYNSENSMTSNFIISNFDHISAAINHTTARKVLL